VRFLVLRLEGPLLSFGDVAVDELRPTLELPTTSMLTGLLANALGFDHREPERHERLQARLLFAARADHPGQLLRDYQTVRLNRNDRLWTTHGRAERRDGWGTVQRERFYRADALITVVLILLPGEDPPGLDTLRAALQRPERPLFLGRKGCPPARPLLDPDLPEVEAESARDALFRVPLLVRGGRLRLPERLPCRWPVGDGCGPWGRERWVHELRDWSTGLHVGGQRVCWASVPSNAFPVREMAA